MEKEDSDTRTATLLGSINPPFRIYQLHSQFLALVAYPTLMDALRPVITHVPEFSINRLTLAVFSPQYRV